MQKGLCKRARAVVRLYWQNLTLVNVGMATGGAQAHSVLLLALSFEGLLAEVSLDLLAEHQHAQVRVGGFVHGFGLDAHAVLFRR